MLAWVMDFGISVRLYLVMYVLLREKKIICDSITTYNWVERLTIW